MQSSLHRILTAWKIRSEEKQIMEWENAVAYGLPVGRCSDLIKILIKISHIKF